MAEGNNILKDFKAPPTLGKSTLYNNWKKEIKIWEAFTSIPEEKRAPAIFMTLAGEAKEAVLNMDLEKLTAKDGVVNLIDTLDRMYLKDESSQAYEAYESFEKFVRPSNMTIADYVIKFEQLYFKAKSFDMAILDGVLAYRLLNSANLTKDQKQLVKATVSKMDYNIMKDQLKKVFTNTARDLSPRNEYEDDRIKVESQEEKSEVLYNKDFSKSDAYYSKDFSKYSSNRGRGRGNFNRGKQNNFHKNKELKNSEKKQNPTNSKGEVCRCNFCGSRFHFVNNCPDVPERFENNI